MCPPYPSRADAIYVIHLQLVLDDIHLICAYEVTAGGMKFPNVASNIVSTGSCCAKQLIFVYCL